MSGVLLLAGDEVAIAGIAVPIRLPPLPPSGLAIVARHPARVSVSKGRINSATRKPTGPPTVVDTAGLATMNRRCGGRITEAWLPQCDLKNRAF